MAEASLTFKVDVDTDIQAAVDTLAAAAITLAESDADDRAVEAFVQACEAFKVELKVQPASTQPQAEPATDGDMVAHVRSVWQKLGEEAIRQRNAAVERAERAEAEAARYRWLRDRNDWYHEPRLDEADGTMWKLCFSTPQRVTDPTDDDSLDAAVDAAIKEDVNG